MHEIEFKIKIGLDEGISQMIQIYSSEQSNQIFAHLKESSLEIVLLWD
jgi:hypothetical protein